LDFPGTAPGHRTEHRVSVPAGLVESLGVQDDIERLVRVSFVFLLEREPPSAILRRFSLSDISRYFPEYDEEIAHRLG
jgi:hypothetical protein